MVASGVGKPDGVRFSEPFVIEAAHQVAREQANTITALGQPTAVLVPRLPTLVGTSASREEGHTGWGLYNTNMNLDLLQAGRSSGTPEHKHLHPQSWCHQRNPGD